ncbi:MAG TPA: hypothetical protein VH063_02110 [Gaiellaceae bacterium]|jgi:hypothetical protein|nr:hypothetical protein [Gaiellaceae bacterium]
MTTSAQNGRLALAFSAFLVVGLALLAAIPSGRAASYTMSIVTASSPMPSTTNFSTVRATVACPSGSTLVGGGDELTRAGSPVPNDGAVTLGLDPSDSGGSPVAGGATTPANWTAYSGYSGMAPGLDTVTAYGMCLSGGPAATVIEAATTATASLGPVTSVCPSGTSLVGGGGGYQSFPGSNNTKVYDSFPSDAAGDIPSNNMAGPTAWTFQGNSNDATAETTTAVAFCATDSSVSTVVAASGQTATAVTGGSTLSDTVTCPSGTTLLDGGSIITSNPSGAGTGGQGVHVIGDFPSDGGGSPVTSSAGSWTVIAEDGGQNLTSLGTEALALCATAPGGGGSGGSGGGSTTTATTPTTTTTATPASGGGPTGSLAPAAAQSRTASFHSGKAGSITIGSGSQSVTVGWPKAATGGTSLTIAIASPFVPKSHGVAATTSAVQVVVKNGSKGLTRFRAPLEITFPGAAGNVTPAFTVGGTHWSAIPALPAATLPTGLADGWYRDSLGNLHIFTLHATIFGLLKTGTGLKASAEPLAFGYSVAAKPLVAGRVTVTLTPTRAATFTLALARSGHRVAVWRKKLTAAPRTLSLAVPRTARPGAYRLSLRASAAGKHVAHSASVRILPAV